MRTFVATIDKCEHEFFTEILANSNFNFRVRNVAGHVEIRIHASSKNSIPYLIRDAFLEAMPI